ncbi:type II secretion system protein GspG [Dechloromonas denitrificans]|uniref:type II secretion system protein GspG n=1 Tax=Dechloromonas denitrificans TaxID=281362 RepID=UPI001CF81BC5|nr:type II secretion system protein GspG [Dechloromonas denitrificans]UCV12747.1 type II secretion system protein GspG [Dechloromonas denitrificans]
MNRLSIRRQRINLLGALGWLIPLAVAITAVLWLNHSQPTDQMRKISKARDEIRAISAALIAPRPGGQRMPNSRQGLAVLIEDGTLPHIPHDPWGRAYQYRNPGTIRAWELYSLGPDGIESADDIVGWNLYGGR